METNELQLFVQMDQSAGREQPEELLALLQERIARYTMGDSTSVPIQTAKRLLEGILYCVELNRRFPTQTVAKDAPLRARRQAGVLQAKRLARRAKLLYREAQRMQPQVTNRAFRDSLEAIGPFFRAYDADFFAQEMPCSFDYPLCHPVSDEFAGVEYLLDYLRRWLAESAFLRAFSADALRSLYERYYDDYEDLLVNLYLPAAEMATLCALAGRPAETLLLGGDAFAAVGRRLARLEEPAAIAEMLSAADSALDKLSLGGALLRSYTKQTAQDLLTRLRAAGQR